MMFKLIKENKTSLNIGFITESFLEVKKTDKQYDATLAFLQGLVMRISSSLDDNLI